MAVWGSGYVATKIGLQYAAPFTFLSLRFCFGLLCLMPIVFLWKTRWPRDRRELGHLAIAGLLMHAVQLGGSHYAQYLGMSAGVTALIISCQPLLTAVIASRVLKEHLQPGQWLGVFVGLAGVALVVWHKIDIREVTPGSLACTLIALAGVTAATLYQRTYPLLGSIAFLVIFASILGVSVLHLLMRRGEATRVTSMMYLPPVFAVVLELALFGVVPSALSFAGMAVTCAGVAMTVWKGKWRSSISSR